MKKNISWAMLTLLSLLGVMSSCSSDEDIVFDHEQPAFEIQADKILLEVIVPTTTTDDDEIYIAGPFNGLDDQSVIGNEQYKLTRSEKIPAKRGIYLSPAQFVGGKTLADGYHFVSAVQREEVTALGDTIIRTDYPSVGTRTNVYVNKWAAYFDSNEDEVIEHDGFAVFVDNQTTWANLNLYMWGDVNDLNGGWPGMKPTGTQMIDGVKYTYFDMGAANSGLVENLIFNNGEGAQLPDFNVTLDHDVYLRITDTGVEEIVAGPKHDGFVVYVENNTSWGDALSLYMWGDVNDLNGGWPGMKATGTQVINGVTYTYFDMGEANTGLTEHLIFSNDGASQFDGPVYTIDHDIYLRLTDTGFEEIGGSTPDEPETETYKLYVENQTGWDAIAMYVWGDVELFGGWPGAQPQATETIDGVTYSVWEIGNDGKTYHPILNNNGGGDQKDCPDVITATKNWFFKVDASGWTLVK